MFRLSNIRLTVVAYFFLMVLCVSQLRTLNTVIYQITEETLAPSTPSSTTTSSTKKKNGKKKRRRIPIIVGAGLGTTGTHMFTEATCQLGYPSMHFNLGCIPQTNINANSSTTTTTTTNSNSNSNNNKTIISEEIIPIQYQIAGNLHREVLDTVKQFFAKCQPNDTNCIGYNAPAERFRDHLMNKLKTFVTHILSLNETIALHDTPWPSLLPTLLEEVNLQYNGESTLTVSGSGSNSNSSSTSTRINTGENFDIVEPVILLSERDPYEYAIRRFKSRHAGRDLICKEKYMTKITTAAAAHTLKGGAFDIIGCINNALSMLPKNETEINNTKSTGTSVSTTILQVLRLDDVLMTIANLPELEKKDMTSKYVKEYQDVVRGKATFSYDMFTKKELTTKEYLAIEISNHIEESRDTDGDYDDDDGNGGNDGNRQVLPCAYVNFWKMIRIPALFSVFR